MEYINQSGYINVINMLQIFDPHAQVGEIVTFYSRFNQVYNCAGSRILTDLRHIFHSHVWRQLS